MSFTLVDYHLLKANLQESIRAVIRSCGPNQRKAECQFISNAIERLDECSEDSIKTHSLNALAYFIRYQIEYTYKFLNPQRSCLYSSLTTSLNLTKENTPDDNDLINMQKDFLDFVKTYSFVGTEIIDLIKQIIKIGLPSVHTAKDIKVSKHSTKKDIFFFEGAAIEDENHTILINSDNSETESAIRL